MPGTILLRRWVVRVGDRVEEGQVLGEVETENAIVELNAHRGGVVAELLVRVGERVEIGQEILRIVPAAE